VENKKRSPDEQKFGKGRPELGECAAISYWGPKKNFTVVAKVEGSEGRKKKMVKKKKTGDSKSVWPGETKGKTELVGLFPLSGR